MKRFYWSLILICLSIGFAGDGAATYTVDEIFENFKAAYEKSKNFSAAFEETTLFPHGKSTARGRFTFSKPNLLRKEYVARKDSSKVEKVIVLDGEYAWSYVPLLEQVNKMKWDPRKRREILPGIGASLEDVRKNYNMKLVPDEAANPKGVYQIQLTFKPHMVTSTVKEILQIWVKEGEWLPVQFGYTTKFEDGEKQSVIVTLSKIERDKKLPPDVFKFVIPEDAEVIDVSEN